MSHRSASVKIPTKKCDPESLSTQSLVWLVTIALLLGLGHGYWSRAAWLVTLSLITGSFVPALESVSDDDALVAADLTR